MTKESEYQGRMIQTIRRLLPGCIILKNDSSYLQGVPDIIVLYKDRWGTIEFKKSKTAKVQPNQEHYIDVMNDMSFAAFLSPENELEVLRDLQLALRFAG